MDHVHMTPLPMSQEELAGLGSGDVAYIRQMSPSDVASLIPDAPELDPNTTLWALIAADGTPIVVTDSHDAALANAWEADLRTLSLH